MNISEKIKDLKKFFFSEEPQTPPADPATPPAEPVKQEATEYQTKEGKVVYIDKLEEGGIVTSDNVPVEDGNYTLVDGTSFTTELGVIKSITLATPAPAPVVDEEMKKQLETLQAKFAAVEKTKANEIAELKAKFEKQNEALKEMFAIVEAIGNNASEKPLEDPKPVVSTENYRKVLESRGKI
jgi:hypothetical protein